MDAFKAFIQYGVVEEEYYQHGGIKSEGQSYEDALLSMQTQQPTARYDRNACLWLRGLADGWQACPYSPGSGCLVAWRWSAHCGPRSSSRNLSSCAAGGAGWWWIHCFCSSPSGREREEQWLRMLSLALWGGKIRSCNKAALFWLH